MRRFEVEPPREDRQPHEQRLLGLGEQPVGPVDRRCEALLPGRRTARAAAQKPQPVQPPGDVDAAHHTHPRRGQLDRQRQAVEPSTDLGHRADWLVVQVEIRPAGPGPLGEQPGGILDGQRRDGHDPLTLDAERFPAGRQHRYPWAMPHDLVEQPRGRVQDVLAIVHDQQQLACPQILDDGLLDAEALLLLQPQSRRDGMAHRGAVVERREFADTHAVTEAVLLARCGLEGEPGLADAADPGQRDQRALAQGGGNAQHLAARGR